LGLIGKDFGSLNLSIAGSTVLADRKIIFLRFSKKYFCLLLTDWGRRNIILKPNEELKKSSHRYSYISIVPYKFGITVLNANYLFGSGSAGLCTLAHFRHFSHFWRFQLVWLFFYFYDKL